jgi:hypothetical protein
MARELLRALGAAWDGDAGAAPAATTHDAAILRTMADARAALLEAVTDTAKSAAADAFRQEATAVQRLRFSLELVHDALRTLCDAEASATLQAVTQWQHAFKQRLVDSFGVGSASPADASAATDSTSDGSALAAARGDAGRRLDYLFCAPLVFSSSILAQASLPPVAGQLHAE